jgi:hypothetical protein
MTSTLVLHEIEAARFSIMTTKMLVRNSADTYSGAESYNFLNYGGVRCISTCVCRKCKLVYARRKSLLEVKVWFQACEL